MSRNRIAASLSATALALGALCAVATPANAVGGGDVNCGGTQITTYNPGLTLTEQSVRVHLTRHFAPCVSLSNPQVTFGVTEERRVTTLSCLTLAQPGTGTREIEWSTGQRSEYSYSRTITNVGGQTVRTETGTVTAGLFQGSRVVQVTTLVTPNLLDCLGSGVTSESGPITLTIV